MSKCDSFVLIHQQLDGQLLSLYVQVLPSSVQVCLAVIYIESPRRVYMHQDVDCVGSGEPTGEDAPCRIYLTINDTSEKAIPVEVATQLIKLYAHASMCTLLSLHMAMCL